MIYAVDLDGTLCTQYCGGYENAEPYMNRIKVVNQLYDAGHHILIYTARGSYIKRVDLKELTEGQLKKWGVKYHELSFQKPHFDVLIDDKVINSEQFFNRLWDWN